MDTQYPLQERYASAKDFLAEISEYHGNDAYVVSPDRALVLARCPVCPRPGREEGILCYQLLITRCGGPVRYGWGVLPHCECSDLGIALALARHKAERFRHQAEELEATYIAGGAEEAAT